MYTIKVNVDTINYKSIIEYYNTNKPENEEDLEVLEKCEGGFQIKIKNYNNPNEHENFKIRQLRWDNRRLISYSLLTMFTKYQLDLLFKSIMNSIGKNNVKKLEFINKTAFRYVEPQKIMS